MYSMRNDSKKLKFFFTVSWRVYCLLIKVQLLKYAMPMKFIDL